MFEGGRTVVNHDAWIRSTIAWLRDHQSGLPRGRRIADWLAPPRCVACGQPGDLGSVDLCACCLAGFRPCEGSVAPFAYADPVGSGLRALKYADDPRPARVLGALLAAWLARQGPPQLLIPVPLHRRRLLERGFNQSALIAREAAAWLGIPVAERLLVRRRDTAPQAGLPAQDRAGNVAGAFVAAPGALAWLAARGLRHAAMIDDVITTGATLHAAAAALAEAGLERLDLRAVAAVGVSENLTDAP